ncbi:MAG: hypothetical protein IRY99_05455 [Isosphaeraceae bacterium]|nr:hypothetical protein [Isosphaeraceae bacterium]
MHGEPVAEFRTRLARGSAPPAALEDELLPGIGVAEIIRLRGLALLAILVGSARPLLARRDRSLSERSRGGACAKQNQV